MDTLFPFKWRHFEGDVMPLCVRWYLRCALSYRDVEELARERGAIGEPHHRVSLGAALRLGVGQVVSALSVRPKKPPSPTWRTFLNSQVKELVALDFFVVPTVTYKVLCVLRMLSHHRASLGPPWGGGGHCPPSRGSP